jgi:RNA polymerase sigma factor (TIGR02999 family)
MGLDQKAKICDDRRIRTGRRSRVENGPPRHAVPSPRESPLNGSGASSNPSEVTRFLELARAGDPSATDGLLVVVYDELRRIAGALLAKESGNKTLQPTALVHEAYLRLIGPSQPGWENRAHFFGAAARAMRRILIDRARASRARRSPAGPNVSLPEEEVIQLESDSRPGTFGDAHDLLALDSALESLRQRDERQHEVVMLRFFAGLTIEQTAEVLNLSPATIKNEWVYARAWLLREIERSSGEGFPR